MIKIEKYVCEIKGTTIDILKEYATATAAFHEMLTSKFGRDKASDLVKATFNIGVEAWNEAEEEKRKEEEPEKEEDSLPALLRRLADLVEEEDGENG